MDLIDLLESNRADKQEMIDYVYQNVQENCAVLKIDYETINDKFNEFNKLLVLILTGLTFLLFQFYNNDKYIELLYIFISLFLWIMLFIYSLSKEMLAKIKIPKISSKSESIIEYLQYQLNEIKIKEIEFVILNLKNIRIQIQNLNKQFEKIFILTIFLVVLESIILILFSI